MTEDAQQKISQDSICKDSSDTIPFTQLCFLNLWVIVP